MTIYTLDLNFQNVPQTIASYLIMAPDGPLLVETGPGSTLDHLIAQLAHHNVQPTDIKHVLVTHIHFDHAGAAGWWAQQGAQIYVHGFGAPHLINPDRLISSATRIYGNMMDVLWGKILPAPEEKVTIVEDGDVIAVGGVQFTVIETPGHARHHHVYRLGDIAFTGDAAGIQLPGFPLVDVPAPPPEFNLEVWQKTIDRLLAENFSAIYPTHFGKIDDATAQLTELKTLMQEATAWIKAKMDAGLTRDEMVVHFNEWNRNRAHRAGLSEDAIRQYETANPWYMSVDGIMRYWRKKA
ncbi:MAG: MBL fold hydrolase [Chloroflexi bacterium]|nr:MAG: MBL fold hydrolase [Chloroflexota bacterium]PIE80323.1 MAG: MBL fold hydrolase [Chloroflexota bacterium]